MISIVIPLYNSEKYIAQTLGSILNQSYKGWECVVVDDGSTDGSVNIVNTVIKDNPKANIQLISQANSGPGIARNTGVAHSKFDYILFLDSDDLISKRLLEKTINAIQINPADVYAYDMIRFGAAEKHKYWIRRHYTVQDLKWNNWLPGTGVVVSKELYNAYGGYSTDMELRKGIEDFDFWLRMSVGIKKVVFIDGVYVHYRVHTSSRGNTIFNNRISLYQYIFKRNATLIGPYRLKYWERAYKESSRHALNEGRGLTFLDLCIKGFVYTGNFLFIKRMNEYFKL